jgi:glycosyltransferase involved in cell wall biosynthesis
MRVVPLGLELQRFAASGAADRRASFREEIQALNRTVVTCVGRLVPIKNHRLLIDAFARVAESNHDVILAIVGGGSEEAALRQDVEERGLNEKVRFLGWRSDLDRVYAGSDVVVLASDNEGTPVSLIEAMSSSCAVVATDVGGVRDVLDGGRLGVLVPPRDPAALADGIAQLVSNPALRLTLATRAAPVALERYDVQRLLSDIRSLYLELLDAKTSRKSPSISPA